MSDNPRPGRRDRRWTDGWGIAQVFAGLGASVTLAEGPERVRRWVAASAAPWNSATGIRRVRYAPPTGSVRMCGRPSPTVSPTPWVTDSPHRNSCATESSAVSSPRKSGRGFYDWEDDRR